jgi:hypothetical protein
MNDNESNEHEHERREGFRVLSEQLKNMHSDLAGVKQALGRLTDAVSHLAVVDERLSQNTSNLGRIQGLIDGIDLRIRTLELSIPFTAKMNSWVERFVIIVVTAVIVAVTAGRFK